MQNTFTQFQGMRTGATKMLLSVVITLMPFLSSAQNDDCANAISLTQASTCTSTAGTTVGGTLSMAASPCSGNPDDDVWFSFVATAPEAKVELTNVAAAVGSSTDAYFQVLSGTCGGAMTSLLCSDPNSGIVGGLTVGQTYYIRVYTYGAATNITFNICVSILPVPTSCGGLTIPVANGFASTTPTLTWTAATNATSYDIYLDATNPPTTLAATVNNAVTYTFPTTFPLGDYYWYVVAKNSSGMATGCATNTRKFTVIPPPANDGCANAVVLTQSATCTNTAGSTGGATLSMAATPCNGNPDDDVWYSFVATSTDAKIDLSSVTAVVGNTTDMYFQVLSGTCGSFTSLLCSDPNSNVVGGLTVGQTYYIRVYTYPLNTGSSFNICVTSLSAAPGCATQNAPAANASVSGTPTFTWGAVTNASSYDIYMGASNPPTTLIATANGNSTVSYTLTTPLPPGDYYWYIAPKNSAGAATCTSNSRKFTVLAPPANDEATGAISLVVGAGCASTPYNNTYATQSATEPFTSCKGTAGYAGMWYSFAAPASGAVKISNDFGGTLADSRIALFSATDPTDYSTFTILGCDDDNGVTGATRSLFYAAGLTPGAIYYVLVDLYSSGTTRGTYCVGVDELTTSMITTTGLCAADQASVAAYNATYHGWISLVDGTGKLNANVRQTTGTAVSFKSNVTVNTAALRSDGTGITYLDRNFFVSGDNATSADLQLFYLDAELNTLNSVYGGSVTPANLNVSRVAGNACSSNYTGTATLLPQTASGSSNGVSWVQVATPGFSNFFIHPGNNPLPVQLKDITATNAGTRNRIDWNTSSEEKGDHYIVERSVDGHHYIALGTVTAKGQSSTYSYWDASPVNGINYYRLKMGNAAGDYGYSNTVAAIVRSDGAFTVEAYPNPVSDVVSVKMYGMQGDKPNITITDVTGKVVDVITVKGNDVKINMSNTLPGIYFIKYTDSSNSQTIKVNKQ